MAAANLLELIQEMEEYFRNIGNPLPPKWCKVVTDDGLHAPEDIGYDVFGPESNPYKNMAELFESAKKLRKVRSH
jgi:hypothetical protein